MRVIDDQGRLFGELNVIDALVVLVLLSAVAAGAVLVIQPGNTSPERSSPSGTIEYTVQSSHSPKLLMTNDTLQRGTADYSLTVQDTVYSYGPNGSIHVTARVSYSGRGTIDSAVKTGRTYAMHTGSSELDIRFLALNQSTDTLQSDTFDVVLALDSSSQVSHVLEAGDTARIGNRSVATIKSISEVPNATDDRVELVGVELHVWRPDGTPRFGGRAIRVNQRLTVVTDDVILPGRVYAIGTTNTTRSLD